MFEMSKTRENHRQPVLIAIVDAELVFDRPARLNH